MTHTRTSRLNPPDQRGLGAQSEDRALDYLRGRGFRLITRNYRTSGGELDLIGIIDHELIFVEVRSRTNADISPIETIGISKRSKLVSAAREFLQNEGFQGCETCRFDFISVIPGEPAKIDIFENAIEVDRVG